MKINAIIGVDGGGTKTKFLLADLHGRIILSKTLGPSTTGIYNEQKEVFYQGIKSFGSRLLQDYTIKSVFVSLGGFFDPQIVDFLKTITRAKLVAVERESSGFLVSQCAPIWGFDIVVMAGTGSVAVGIDVNGNIINNGGWGPILDDRGSGFSLGKYGLRAISDFIDGRGDWTLLVPLIMSSDLICEDSIEKEEIRNMDQKLAEMKSDQLRVLLKNFLRKINRYNTAALAPLVIQAARQDDFIAKDIVYNAGTYLAGLAVAIGEKLKTDFNKEMMVTIGIGGLFNAGNIIYKPLQKKITELVPYISFEEKRFSIAIGTVLCALRNIGVEINNKILYNLKNCKHE